jgi:hypothetical protein
MEVDDEMKQVKRARAIKQLFHERARDGHGNIRA